MALSKNILIYFSSCSTTVQSFKTFSLLRVVHDSFDLFNSGNSDLLKMFLKLRMT